MEKHFNGLTPAEAERLAILAEECGEVIHVIGKILRHGYYSRHPQGGDTNKGLLEKELGDLLFTINFISTDLNTANIELYTNHKWQNINRWLHHSEVETSGSDKE